MIRMPRGGCVAVAIFLYAPAAIADTPQSKDSNGTAATAAPPEDPTGGAYTSPTLLFIPAGAVPAWSARIILSTELQGPADVDATVRPGLGAELGLPAGFTLGAGTNWVGGDVDPDTGAKQFNLGLSPYAQLRFHITGAADGRGFQLGTSATYKFVGFQGDPGEMEWAISAQYRVRFFEVGVQGVLGKDFATTDADSELHAYAVYRAVPQLALGGATQLRVALVSQPGETTYDVIGGAIASLTIGRWQIAGLVGESTVGLNQGQVGALGQIFGTALF